MRKFRSAPLAATAFISLVALLVLAGLTATHGAADKQDVRIVNTTAEPVPIVAQGTTTVRDADEPARHAFQTTVSIIIPHADSAAQGAVIVPFGKRLVVEFVSVRGIVLSGRALFVHVESSGDVGAAIHEIALNDPRLFGNDIYSASHPVRIYAEANAGLLFTAEHGSSASGALDSQVSIGISGYLVDMP